MINGKRVCVLIPMKGNSERVPNKNLKSFDGSPLYHKVVQVAKNSKYVDHIVVNTDSLKLKSDIQQNFGEQIKVRDRKQEICGDMISMNLVIEDDLENTDYDIYVQTHSTNPLLLSSSLDNALKKMLDVLKSGSNDSIFSVTKLQTRLYDQEGRAYNHDPNKLIRTQDLPPLYEENSNFFIFTKESFRASGNKRIGNQPLMFEIGKIEAVDIDEPQDFIIAEALYKLLR